MFRTALTAVALVLPVAAEAETELSFYGGIQEANASDVTFAGDGTIPDSTFNVGWEGRSFDAPPYYGFRATIWQSPTFGYGLDFTHAKIYPEAGELPPDFDRLEFTDGLNTVTANVYRRWPEAAGAITPYLGAGVGISVPYVEVDYGDSRTRGYQFAGPAATLIAGASYDLAGPWAVFGEYKGTYTMNEGDLETGGTVSTDVFTNAINFGVSYTF